MLDVKYYALFFLPFCQCFLIEITLTGINEHRTIKLVCGNPTEIANIKTKHAVLWAGSQFGKEEQDKLSEFIKSDELIPNILINSPKHHHCYLLTDKNTFNSLSPEKKRILRDSAGKFILRKPYCELVCSKSTIQL